MDTKTCSKCRDRALGPVKDSVETLKALISYLEESSP